MKKNKTSNIVFLLLSIVGVLIAVLYLSGLFTPTSEEKEQEPINITSETEENLIDKEYALGSNENLIELTNDDLELLDNEDIIDAKNYITNTVEESYLRNIFLSVLDINVWLFNNRNNDDLIGENAEKVMLSTFCLASNVTPSQRAYLFNMMDLLVGYDPVLHAEYQNIVFNLQDNHPLPVPDKNNSAELCSIFLEYPAEGFELFQTEVN